MNTGGTIQATLGGDNGPFIAMMEDSKVVAQRGATSIQSKFTSIFKRSPNMRAERAFSGLFQSLASGDIAGGIESLTARMTGLGLVAGVAIGAGVAIFVKFKEQIDATREAHAALEMEMVKHPLSTISKLSTEGMTQALEARQKLLENAAEKAKHTFGSQLSEAFQSMFQGFGGDTTEGEAGKERIDQQKLENQAALENKDIMMKRAELAERLSAIERMRERSGDHIASLAKINLEFEQKIAALKLQGLSAAAFRKQEGSLTSDLQAAIHQEDKRADAKERSLQIEEKMAALIKKGLSPEDQRKVRAGLELGSINAAIPGAEGETKRSLLLQKAQKENELRGMGKPGEENPYNQGTLSARDWERQKDSAKFNENFASLGLTQEQKDRKSPAAPNSEIVSAVNETNEILRQVFLK